MLLICDWDGTIANSVPQIIACKQALAKKYDVPLPTATLIRNVLGKEFKQAMKICFPTISGTLLEQLCNEFKLLMQTDEYQAAVFPDALPILRKLKLSGYKLAVATSKSRAELDHAFETLKISGLFDVTCCAEEYEAKPSPKMLEVIFQKLMVAKKLSVMLGDAESDLLSAKNAGIKVICVTFGAQTKKQLIVHHPDAFINSWQELPTALTNIRIGQVKL